MKTIKIFLASSDELKQDRDAFGNLVRKLDKIYEKRGIRIELFEWEDYDAAYNNVPKQDEYDEQVRASDMFLALFHIKGGKFTIREFNVATEEFRKRASPKVYVYCKDLQPSEKESAELAEFKRKLYEDLGHYWCRYSNTDTMQLHFVMQLQLVENSQMKTIKVEEDGRVTLDGFIIAHMDQLPFAACNESYQKMRAELQALPDEIGGIRQLVEKTPHDEALTDELQKKLNRYNQLKVEFSRFQENLFETAKIIASLQQQQVNARVRFAIEAFETGNLERANALLEENEREAELHMELLMQEKKLVHQDINAFRLQAKILIADINIPISDRITRISDIYAKAYDWAQRSEYNEERYAWLLFDYTSFLYDYGKYLESIQVLLHQITLFERVYGREHPNTATSYHCIGLVYYKLGDFPKALEYYFRALAIREKVLGQDHIDLAASFTSIGSVYYSMGYYTKALEYYFKDLAICERTLNVNSPLTASVYNNIGMVYYDQGNYAKSLECFLKTLSIYHKVLSVDHPFTATAYNNIGLVYFTWGEYLEVSDYYFMALEDYFKALAIREKVLGVNHPDTASSYNNIGQVYQSQGDNSLALEYYFKALTIREKVLGINHPDTAMSYNNIATVYCRQNNYQKALEYSFKALDIQKNVLGEDHPNTAATFNNIGVIYYHQGEYSMALENINKALLIRKNKLGENHPITQQTIDDLESVRLQIGCV